MIEEFIIQLSERGQMVIPKKIRKIVGLEYPSRIRLVWKNQKEIILEPMVGFTEALQGSAKHLLKGKKVIDYVRKLREE